MKKNDIMASIDRNPAFKKANKMLKYSIEFVFYHLLCYLFSSLCIYLLYLVEVTVILKCG